MAHTATVRVLWLGSMDFKIVINETEAGAATEKVITLNDPEDKGSVAPKNRQIPRKFRLFGLAGQLRSGSGTTISPRLEARTTEGDWQVYIQAAAGAEVIGSYDSGVGFPVYCENDQLRHLVVCDAGTDNATRTEYLCRRGWADTDYENLQTENLG